MDLPTTQKVALGALYLLSLIASIAVHEFGHAFVADRLGDPMPRAQGRVTLNPMAHIDPWGTIAFPLIAFFTGLPLLGWGKPVQVSLNPRTLKHGLRPKHAHLLVAAAGPSMNLLFAVVLSVAFVALHRAGVVQLGAFVGTVVAMNIGLAIFNLIPIPPLDGGAVLAGLLPDGSPVVGFLRRYGGWVFIALVMTPLIGLVMAPAGWVSRLWMGQLATWIR